MIKIICRFNPDYELFLDNVYNHIIVNYGNDLRISGLHKIEMIESIPGDSDGRMIDEHTIHLSARLYNQLPTLNIEALHGNDVFDLIISTLFHELCHISEISILPLLHTYAFSQDGVEFMTAHFWIEYIVGKKTSERMKRDKTDLCKDIAKRAWRISKLNYDDADSSNFFYLIKVSSYVLSHMRCIGQIDVYLESVINPIVKNMFFELSNEVSRLEDLYPFDDISTLKGIENIFSNHWDYFMKRKVFMSNI